MVRSSRRPFSILRHSHSPNLDMTRFHNVACPHCGKSVEWAPASRWRPFCSERCKTIDLGAWASEAYRVPIAEDPNRGSLDEESDDNRRDG